MSCVGWDTLQGVVALRGIPDCFSQLSQEELGCLPQTHIFLFSQHTGMCPLSTHKKMDIVFPLPFSSVPELQPQQSPGREPPSSSAENHSSCKADPASGWNRLTKNKSGSNQTKVHNEILFLPSLSYPFISPYSNNLKALWEPLEHK